ncbi:MAG: M15 family metallopeptidase [Acidimicrobiales bacterium]|nr:M15 family metallopeptidase [Acidimicrobiales bacterium]
MNTTVARIPLLAALFVVASCTATATTRDVEAEASVPRTTATTTVVSVAEAQTTSSLAPTSTAQVSTTTEAKAPPSEPPPSFTATVSSVDADDLGSSWRPGCPVDPEDLRLIEVTHWNNSGQPVTGQLVAHESASADLVQVFRRLFDVGFTIERMELVQNYDGDDDLSMAANNTSAFNCREVAWRPGVWSLHAYGLAIDINPLLNPYVSATRLLPPEGAQYADRGLQVAGMIHGDGPVVEAFASVGWGWGGYWASGKDYQHFDRR